MCKIDLNKIEFTKINLIKSQENYLFRIQMIQDRGFRNPTLGIGLTTK